MIRYLFSLLFLMSYLISPAQLLSENSLQKHLDEGSKQDTAFRKAPYVLYAGENDKMLILWQLHTSDSCTFSYGTDTTYSLLQISTGEYGNDHQHKTELKGLTPGTKYYYKVEVDSANFATGSFRAGAPSTAKNLAFFAYGDTRTYPDKHNLVAAAVTNKIAQRPAAHTIIISSGDFVSNGNKEKDWDDEFFDPQYTNIRKMLANLPYLGAVGNHEGQGNLFGKYFPYPHYMNGRYYFSFDYGPVHFTVIDQFTNLVTGGTQYNWIVNDLSTTAKKWKIVVLHKPGWSAGGGHSNNSTVQNVLQPLFVQYGVQFVVAGHNHYYARAVVNGIEHITTGGGGAPLYNPNPAKDSIVKVDKSYHYCFFDVRGDTLTFTAVRADGSIIESFDYTINNTGINHYYANEPVFNVSVTGKKINISTSFTKDYAVEIYDSIGRRVYKRNKVSSNFYVRINSAGVYFVRLIFSGKHRVKKVVVN